MKKIIETVGRNLQDGTIYKYFYTQVDKAADAESRLKTTFSKKYSIESIEERLSFAQINSRYDALVKIAKDIIILNPTNLDRRAFVCIYSNDNFEIAFYRELNSSEASDLCGMIKNKSLIAS